jgi:DNA-binding GntR family transcriptional regulator
MNQQTSRQQVAANESSPIARLKLATQIVSRLRDEIIMGKWAPGESLPSHVLSAQFGVSHIPIREAFLVLESEGFLRLAPNRMAIVTEPTFEDTRGKLLLQREFEGLAAALACNRATDEQIEELRRLQAELETRSREHDLVGYHQANLRFHRCIVEAADNQSLANFHQIIIRHLEWARVRSQIRGELLPQALEQHARLIECIAKRDAVGARKATEEHYETVGDFLLERVKDREQTSAD